MKNYLDKIDKAFENRIRLAVMSLLMVNDEVEFNTLKGQLGLTDGNLASHMATLEKSEYIEVRKVFSGKKPVTTYLATALGRKAFLDHLNALEQLIQSVSEEQ